MGLADDAYDFIVAAFIIVVGLYVITAIITDLVEKNPLFASIIFGGILAAIVTGAGKILNRA